MNDRGRKGLVIATVMAAVLLVSAAAVISVLVLSEGSSNESREDFSSMFTPSEREIEPTDPDMHRPDNDRPHPPEDPSPSTPPGNTPPSTPPGNTTPPPSTGNNGPSISIDPNTVPSTNDKVNGDIVKNLASKAEYDAVIAAAEQYVKGTAGDIKGYKFGAAFTGSDEANVQYMKPDGSIYDLKLKKVGGTWKVTP
jgi:hypothetical protein